MKTSIGAALGLALLSTTALSQTAPPGRQIGTGGASGAYHTTFCPPLPGALSRAYFHGYACTTSRGTLENLDRVVQAPTGLGFAQSDVLARRIDADPSLAQRVAVVRSDIACEGLWMVTRNPDLDFGRILGLARRIRFILPPEGSGSSASFDYLRSIDPEGLGRAQDANIERVANAMAVIKGVAEGTQGEVGFFVQWANPRNEVIRAMVETPGLRVIPVASREILRAQVGGQKVYALQDYTLSEGGLFGIGGKAVRATTACTQVALVTGAPGVPGADKAEQEELIARLRAIPPAALLPQDDFLRSVVAGAKGLTQRATDAALDVVERSKNAVAGQ